MIPSIEFTEKVLLERYKGGKYMKNSYLISMGFTILLITLLMAYDFFPRFQDLFYIPKVIIIGLLLLVLLFGGIRKGDAPKMNFWWQMILVSYLLGLMIIFTLFGGTSQVGLSLSSPVIWVLLIFSSWGLIKEYNKMKMKLNESNL